MVKAPTSKIGCTEKEALQSRNWCSFVCLLHASDSSDNLLYPSTQIFMFICPFEQSSCFDTMQFPAGAREACYNV